MVSDDGSSSEEEDHGFPGGVVAAAAAWRARRGESGRPDDLRRRSVLQSTPLVAPMWRGACPVPGYVAPPRAFALGRGPRLLGLAAAPTPQGAAEQAPAAPGAADAEGLAAGTGSNSDPAANQLRAARSRQLRFALGTSGAPRDVLKRGTTGYSTLADEGAGVGGAGAADGAEAEAAWPTVPVASEDGRWDFLFLDVDGVLNTIRTETRPNGTLPPLTPVFGEDGKFLEPTGGGGGSVAAAAAAAQGAQGAQGAVDLGELDPVLLARLAQLCSSCGPRLRLVLSSPWRRYQTMVQRLRDALEALGVDRARWWDGGGGGGGGGRASRVAHTPVLKPAKARRRQKGGRGDGSEHGVASAVGRQLRDLARHRCKEIATWLRTNCAHVRSWAALDDLPLGATAARLAARAAEEGKRCRQVEEEAFGGADEAKRRFVLLDAREGLTARGCDQAARCLARELPEAQAAALAGELALLRAGSGGGGGNDIGGGGSSSSSSSSSWKGSASGSGSGLGLLQSSLGSPHGFDYGASVSSRHEHQRRREQQQTTVLVRRVPRDGDPYRGAPYRTY
jgi:hypothetical protein